MNHFATPDFWDCYEQLPPQIRRRADKNFELLKSNPYHPSLHFKQVGRFWSARIGRSYRAVAEERDEGFFWFWIGAHDAYDRLIS